jgi:hypothetical protein
VPRKDIALIGVLHLVVLQVVVVAQEDLDRRFVISNLLLAITKSITGSSHKSRTGSSAKSIGQVSLRSELQFTFVGIITRLRLIVVTCVVLGIARSKVGLVVVLDVVLGIIVRVRWEFPDCSSVVDWQG